MNVSKKVFTTSEYNTGSKELITAITNQKPRPP